MWLLWSGKNTRGLSSCKPTGKNKLLKQSKPKAEVQLVDLYHSCCRCRGSGGGGVVAGSMFPQEIFKNAISCIHWTGIGWAGKSFNAQTKLLTIKWNLWSGNYNYWFVVVCFSVDSKINSQSERVYESLMTYGNTQICPVQLLHWIIRKSNKKRFSLSLKKILIFSCANYQRLLVKQPDVASGFQPEMKPLLV